MLRDAAVEGLNCSRRTPLHPFTELPPPHLDEHTRGGDKHDAWEVVLGDKCSLVGWVGEG